MNLIVVAALALVAVAAAAPAEQLAKVVTILRSDFEQNPDGGYVYSYETDDGTSRSENGEKKVVNDDENKPHEVVVMRGQYSYVDPDGKTHTVTYVADENGFKAESDDIPKAPAQA